MQHSQYIALRHHIRDIIIDTQWDGHVFCVGGCVHDDLMNNEIKDIDLVVDIPNGGVLLAQWMHDQGIAKGNVVTYPSYGTAMFRLKAFPEIELECVQTRKEKYPDLSSRNPVTAFGTIAEDCMRRDLTINSLYLNVSTDLLIDITGRGVEDIKNHIIRTTDTPDIIYDDDPLRILRCIRFATRFGWDIDEDTFKGMIHNAYRLEIISHERIRDEFDKMMTCNFPVRALQLLRQTGAMHFVIPEMEETYDMTQNKYHFGTVWEHTLKVIDNVKSNDLTLRMAALLHDIGKITTRSIDENSNVHFISHETESAALCETILRRLKYSVDFIRQIQFLVRMHMVTKPWKDDLSLMKPRYLRKLQYQCGSESQMMLLLDLIDADNNAHAEGRCLRNQVRLIRKQIEKMKEDGTTMFDYKLPFNGKEIMDIKSITPGPQVKECQNYLLKLAFVSPLRSREELKKHLIGYKLTRQ